MINRSIQFDLAMLVLGFWLSRCTSHISRPSRGVISQRSREIQAKRVVGTALLTNADMSPKELRMHVAVAHGLQQPS